MTKITVNASKNYNVIISRGILPDCAKHIEKVIRAKKLLIVTDTNVATLYEPAVRNSLLSSGFETYTFIFEAGERSKRLSTIENIYKALSQNHFTRSDAIVALGGGVCGDMAGFAAATYMRGIEYISIPTSLLSQVDSSVGGKTGVDTDFGKNLVGAFYQPSLVLIDPDTLNTLKSEFFTDGMGEVIKYGCIRSTRLFERLENENVHDIIEEVIELCIKIKRDIVVEDEREKGVRMILNFGHTIGHAVEKLSDFSISHGQGVSIGMVMITQAGEKHGICKQGTAENIERLCKKYGLSVSTDFDIDAISKAVLSDKKSDADNINIVIADKIGSTVIHKQKLCDFCDFIS